MISTMKDILSLFLILLAVCCKPVDQETFSVADLQVTWSVIENLGGTYANGWKLTNQGAATFPAADWALYYNHVVGVPVPESISGSLQVTQISGTFYRITPTKSFTALGQGESTSIDLVCFGSGIKLTDAPSGLYWVMNGSEPQPVNDYQIAPFPPEELMRRSDVDHVRIPTAASRFRQNEPLFVVSNSEMTGIIPTPMEMTTDAGVFELPENIAIGFKPGLEREADLLLKRLSSLGQNASVTEDFEKAQIQLEIATYQNESERYELTVKTQSINIRGSDQAGVYYGTQSLIALWPLPEVKQKEIACQTIKDRPRFSYRGMHLDVARNFQKPEAIKKVLDIMSFYKLNKLHFHLTDDEGWRLQIRDLPELTSVGAVRGHTLDEKGHLFPAYGSGPKAHAPDNHGTGFYSRQEFVDILKFASERHIEVIPEINFPGHARAAIKAMDVRSRRIEEESSDEPGFILHDPNDQSQYSSVQGYNDNVICPCQESVYRFIETVVSEIVSIYQEAGVSLTTIHTGGDEVPSGIWENSPLCEQFLRENPQIQGVEGLPGYFLQRYHQILEQQDLVTAGWEEIAMKKEEAGSHDLVINPDLAESNLVPYVWNSNWGTHDDLAYKLANAGYKIVMCNANNLYFDFAYNKHPLEPGFYWSGLVDTRKPFELVPFAITQTATHDIMGNPLDLEQYEDHEKLTVEGRMNILGLQGQLWSETVKGPEMLEYYLFPKMIGLAERAWAKDPEWANLPRRSQRLEGLELAWNIFANQLAHKELTRLDHLWNGVNYRVPLPGAVIEEGNLKANVGFPGLQIRYTLDGSEPNSNSILYQGPVAAKKPVKLKAFTATGKSSRTSTLTF